MTLDLDAQLLDVASRYSEATGTPLSTIGRETVNDTAFFSRLSQKDRSCRTVTYAKVLTWIADRWPEGLEWPEGVIRPQPSEAA